MTAVKEITSMLEMLPSEEQNFACEVMKKLILAWDSDFTKLTPAESEELKIAHMQISNGEVFDDDEIDWDCTSVKGLPKITVLKT
jgi:hypothetical protein